MNRTTFEILSRYISNSNGANIVFDEQGVGASTDMRNGTIHMPAVVGDKNVFAILALLMHESAHVKYSKEAMEKCVTSKSMVDQHIFNVIEDYRVDQKNYNKLPNVKSFYKRLVADHCDYSNNTDNVPFPVKILLTALLNIGGFGEHGFQSKDVKDFINNNPIADTIQKTSYHIDSKSWAKAKEGIQKIKEMLQMSEEQAKQATQQKVSVEIGTAGEGKGGKGKDENDKMLDGIAELLQPSSLFSDSGTALKGASSQVAGEIALEEQTINQFKELLNITERKVVEDGTTLNTDSLISYFTEDLEELFTDEAYIKRKKSKILFLLDGSGSMSEYLLDGNPRNETVSKCVERMTRILKEVQETEGINVDWDIAKFESSGCVMLNKASWKQDYYAGGGTNLSKAFKEALEILEKDFTIEGKKLIIVLTDGDVGFSQIEEMKKMIINHNTNVKALVIGVGTDPAGFMATEILGDSLILSEENANIVILDTIRRLL